jgi:hypothetical protein
MAALDDIREKLDRANEHIEQLDRKVEAFLDEAPDRKLIYKDPKEAEAFQGFQSKRIVPPCLSIVVGEVLYQLRSALDHIICALIRKEGASDERGQFPIWSSRPSTQKELARYEGQIKGITRQEIRTAIQLRQPYNRTDPVTDPLAVLALLSNRDKHRSLLLSVVVIDPTLDVELRTEDGFDISHHSLDDGTPIPEGWVDPSNKYVTVVEVKRSLTTRIAFEDWRMAYTGIPAPLAEGLKFLSGVAAQIAADFGRFF